MELGEQIIEYYHSGWSVEEIVRKVCGGSMWIEFVQLGRFARKWLVLSYLSREDFYESGVNSQV